MKVFGCLAFASNTVPLKDKFDPRAFKCVFLGYVVGQKAFKLFDLENQKIFVSRDVIFYEDVFPFTVASLSSNDTCPIPIFFPEPNESDPTHKKLLILLKDINPQPDLPSQTESLNPQPDLPSQIESLPSNSSIPNSPSSLFQSVINSESPNSSTLSIRPDPTTPTGISTRKTKPLSWLSDYGCSHVTDSYNTYSLADVQFCPQYTAFMNNVTQLKEPHSYKEAAKHR